MRLALYARVSTEEQKIHGLSIDAQLSTLREWAEGKTVVGEYVDAGISGRITIKKRPELQRLLKDVEAGRVDVIAFCKLDRWTRNIREYYKAQDVLDAHNVAWRALQEDYETETAAGRLKVNIMLAVAQDEADRASERVKAVFADKRKRGLAPTGSVPLGIKLENGKEVPSEDAPIVRQMFNEFIACRSARAVAKTHQMTAEGVSYLLRNERYLNAKIIDRSVWETVQGILSARTQRHVRTDRIYLFSGLVFCSCGSPMSCAAVTRNGTTYVYYRCSIRSHNPYTKCTGKNVSERDLEAWLLSKTVVTAEQENTKIRKKKKKAPDMRTIRSKMDKLTDLYMNDLITREKYESDYRDLQTQLVEAERQPAEVDTKELKTLLDAYKFLTPTGKKAFWSRMIRRIDVTEDGFSFTLNYT